MTATTTRPRHLIDLNAKIDRFSTRTVCGRTVSRAGSLAIRESDATCPKCVVESMTRVQSDAANR